MRAATDVAAPASLPRLQPPPLAVSGVGFAGQDDQTLIARPKFLPGLSVHEEPTVIGQIPREALDYERAAAHRTQALPINHAPAATPAREEPALPRFSSIPPSSLPEGPESPQDETRRASPRAFARSEPPTRPMASALRLPVSASPRQVPAVVATRDEPTLVSGALPAGPWSAAAFAPSRWQVTRVALMLLALGLVSFLLLKVR